MIGFDLGLAEYTNPPVYTHHYIHQGAPLSHIHSHLQSSKGVKVQVTVSVGVLGDREKAEGFTNGQKQGARAEIFQLSNGIFTRRTIIRYTLLADGTLVEMSDARQRVAEVI